jgi:hypothetical protein
MANRGRGWRSSNRNLRSPRSEDPSRPSSCRVRFSPRDLPNAASCPSGCVYESRLLHDRPTAKIKRRMWGVLHFVAKLLRVDRQRLIDRRQRRLTFSAASSVGQVRRRDPLFLTADLTGSNQRHGLNSSRANSLRYNGFLTCCFSRTVHVCALHVCPRARRSFLSLPSDMDSSPANDLLI